MSWVIKLNLAAFSLITIAFVAWMIKDSIAVDHDYTPNPLAIAIDDRNLAVTSEIKTQFYRRGSNNDWRFVNSINSRHNDIFIMSNDWFIDLWEPSGSLPIFKFNNENKKWHHHQTIEQPPNAERVWRATMDDNRLILNNGRVGSWRAHVYALDSETEKWELSQTLSQDNLLETINCQEDPRRHIGALDSWLVVDCGDYSNYKQVILYFFKYNDSTEQYEYKQELAIPTHSTESFVNLDGSLVIQIASDNNVDLIKLDLDTDLQTWSYEDLTDKVFENSYLEQLEWPTIIARDNAINFNHLSDENLIFSLKFDESMDGWKQHQVLSDQTQLSQTVRYNLRRMAAGENRLAISATRDRLGSEYTEIYIFKYLASDGLWKLEDTIKSRHIGYPKEYLGGYFDARHTFIRKLTVILLFSSVSGGMLALLLAHKVRNGRLQ